MSNDCRDQRDCETKVGKLFYSAGDHGNQQSECTEGLCNGQLYSEIVGQTQMRKSPFRSLTETKIAGTPQHDAPHDSGASPIDDLLCFASHRQFFLGWY